MILCEGLTKRFGQRAAVARVTFEIRAGEVCAMMGPNGAGKSTLIRLLAGLTEADDGRASVTGHDPRVSSREFRKAIGVVPDNLALLPELTIEEHLAACGPIYGLGRDTTLRRANELLSFFDLDEARGTYARHGSHGMRKKTAIALALLHDPAVLMLDEPFEGLDPAAADALAALLASLGRRGATILFTSHMIGIVDRIATRVVVLRDGALVCDQRRADLPEGAGPLYSTLVATRASHEMAWLGSRQS